MKQCFPRLLVFDLDGTLVDSRRDLVNCVNATLAHFDLPKLEDNRIAAFVGDGAAALVRRSMEAVAGKSAGLEQCSLDFFLAHYNEHLLDHTRPYPGVLETLSKLQSLPNAPRMAVLTNKPVRPSQRICDALNFSGFMVGMYGGNSFAEKKPAPIGLRTLQSEAERFLGVQLLAEEVVMIGDSEVDVRTARNAGVSSVGCTWGFATDKLLAEQPDYLAHRPEDWLDLFRQA